MLTACLAALAASLPGQTATGVPSHPAAQQPAPAPTPAPASSPAATPAMLSSRAAYDEAVRPLEMTRRAIGNWSDVELAALNLAIQQAASACSLRDPLHIPIDELVDLARLCGVGQNWELDMIAAHRYISAGPSQDTPDKPQLAQAYADAVEAELRLKMGSAALQTAEEMLAKVPYDGLTSGAYNMALDYLEFVDTKGAIELAERAQPLLLARLKAVPEKASEEPAAASAADLSATQTYRDALRLPGLEVYRNNLQQAGTLAAAVESSLPATLSGDDTLLIAAERRRFALLGHRLPLVDIALSLDPQRAPAQELPLPGMTTALLLFPDWCAQCVRMGPQFPEGTFTVGGRPAAFYALLATTRPSSTPPSIQGAMQGSGAPVARTPLDQLRGTPTLLVPATTLLQMEATDYPLLLLVDEKGIVRLHQPVGEDALQSGSTVDTAIASLGTTVGTSGHTPVLRAPAAPVVRR